MPAAQFANQCGGAIASRGILYNSAVF